MSSAPLPPPPNMESLSPPNAPPIRLSLGGNRWLRRNLPPASGRTVSISADFVFADSQGGSQRELGAIADDDELDELARAMRSDQGGEI